MGFLRIIAEIVGVMAIVAVAIVVFLWTIPLSDVMEMAEI